MVDTVKFNLVGDLAWRCADALTAPAGWKSRDTRTANFGPNGRFVPGRSFRGSEFFHDATGLRIWGRDQPETIEFSVPRVLYENNSVLVRTDAEISSSVDAALAMTKQVVDGVPKVGRLRRVDLVWHFAGTPAKWFPFFGGIPHPLVEGMPRRIVDVGTYDGGNGYKETYLSTRSRSQHVTTVHQHCHSIVWKGQDRTIRLYDKLVEVGVRSAAARNTPSVLRLEVSLRGAYAELMQLKSEALWAKYRDVCLRFARPASALGVANSSKVDELVLAFAADQLSTEYWLGMLARKHPRTRVRYMRRVRELREVWQGERGAVLTLPATVPAKVVSVDEYLAKGGAQACG